VCVYITLKIAPLTAQERQKLEARKDKMKNKKKYPRNSIDLYIYIKVFCARDQVYYERREKPPPL